MNKRAMVVGTALACIWLRQAALASPSGLNNIPTADTPPDQVIVLQTYDTFGADRQHDLSAGMKFGLAPWGEDPGVPHFEGGVDGHILPGDFGPAVFQSKLSIALWADGPTAAIGAANVAVSNDERDRVGEPFDYFVLSQDLKLFRLHAGYSFQSSNYAAFAGADVTFPLFERNLTLRTDAIQIQDQAQWLASVGAMYQLTDNIALETWTSMPTEHGKPTFTVKLDWVLGKW